MHLCKACDLQLDYDLPSGVRQFDGLADILPLAEHEHALQVTDPRLQPNVERPEEHDVVHYNTRRTKLNVYLFCCGRLFKLFSHPKNEILIQLILQLRDMALPSFCIPSRRTQGLGPQF